VRCVPFFLTFFHSFLHVGCNPANSSAIGKDRSALDVCYQRTAASQQTVIPGPSHESALIGALVCRQYTREKGACTYRVEAPFLTLIPETAE